MIINIKQIILESFGEDTTHIGPTNSTIKTIQNFAKDSINSRKKFLNKKVNNIDKKLAFMDRIQYLRKKGTEDANKPKSIPTKNYSREIGPNQLEDPSNPYYKYKNQQENVQKSTFTTRG